MERLNRRGFLKVMGLTVAGMAIPACRSTLAAAAGGNGKRPPNFVIIFIDDMGYADVGRFGAEGYATPNLDRMAGRRDAVHRFLRGRRPCARPRGRR